MCYQPQCLGKMSVISLVYIINVFKCALMMCLLLTTDDDSQVIPTVNEVEGLQFEVLNVLLNISI